MPIPSKVEQLPDSILAAVNRQMAQGTKLDDIVAWLESMDLDDAPSRSSLGRYKISREKLAADLRNSRIVAEAIVGDAAASGMDSQMGRVAVETIQGIVMKMAAANLTGETPEFDPKELNQLSQALKNSMHAQEIDDRRRAKIREEALKEAADAASEGAIARGLTKEAADSIRSDILGLK